jgi:hypothetical protein
MVNMVDRGYFIKEDNVKFVFNGYAKNEVRLVGNFNGWSENESKWKMNHNPKKDNWELEIPITMIKSMIKGDFYEFTFFVDGEFIDADKDAPNLNYCPGYGYRYLLNI